MLPGLSCHAPDGRAPRAGVRAHHGVRLPQPDLRDAVPRAVVRAVADLRGRHGAGVPVAPHVPAAPAVAPSRATVGAEVARATSGASARCSPSTPTRCWCRRTAIRCGSSRRSDRSSRGSARSRATTASIPEAAAEFAELVMDGLDRSVTAREDGTVPADRVVDVQFAAFMARAVRDDPRRLRTARSRAHRRSRRRACARSWPRTRSDRFGGHHYTWAETELDEGEWRERAARYQEYFDVPSESLDSK